MSKERELLARCLEHLEWVTEFPEGDDMEEVAEEIRDYLANANPPEAEPVAWRRYNPVHSTIQDELEENNNGTPIYLHPAPRKDFVRLSQEEIQTIYLTRYDTPNLFARAIEDALEEKNK